MNLPAAPTVPSPRDIADAAFFAALADPLRIHLLRRLADAPCCVGVLVEACGTMQPKVSRHLAALRAAGLVEVRAEGKKRCYSITNAATIRALLGALDGLPVVSAPRLP